jgi:hypothetical protein
VMIEILSHLGSPRRGLGVGEGEAIITETSTG